MENKYVSRLESLRQSEGFTQAEVGSLSGVAYFDIVIGKRPLRTKDCLLLSALFDTSMDYILGRTDDPRPYPPGAEKPTPKPGKPDKGAIE